MQADSKRATLRAILFADLQQFSRLTAADELATLDLVTRSFELFREHCAGFGAEFVKTTGDGVLILFDSASSAVDYAMSIQARFRASNPAIGSGLFRIGIHMGEVHRRGGDVFGHAVNLAARIEAQAEPGEVCVSEAVYRAARESSAHGFRFGGRVALRNFPELVPLYHVFALDAAPARERGERLAVSVIDGLSMSTEQGDPLPLRSRKAQALVGYLALGTRAQEAQDRVAALIWPERSLPEARRALANCVKLVEAAIAPVLAEGLVRRGSTVGLNQARTEVDLVRILDDLGAGKVDDLLLERSDWPDAILGGLEATSPLFAAWLSVARHNQRAKGSEGLEAMLQRFDDSEPAVRRAASALLLLEPSHERAAQHLIRHHKVSGNLSAAVRVYESLREVMRDRFKLSPSGGTDALIRNLAAPPPGADAKAAARRVARAPRVAVGSFRAHREALTHAAAGFRADLIANLSKFRELTIVEAQGDETGHDYLLSAESADAEGGVELFVTLAEPDARRVIWSESFILALDRWREAQKRLVGRIASSLEVYLSQDRLSRTLRGPVQDLDAYDAWLRGEHLLTRWSPSGDDEAARLFEHAIAEDPQFAPAYASLASVYNSRHLVRPGVAREDETSRRALELAERAVGADPLDARNHLVVAWSTAMVRRFEQSEVHYELASELNPNNPKTLISAALGLAFMGRANASQELLGRAMTLTPQFLDYQWSHIAAIRYLAGDFGGAVQAADRSKNVIVDTPGWKAAALLRLGRHEEARAALVQLHAAVSAIWEGKGAADIAAVLAWFLSAFPIKRDEDRVGLTRLHDLV